MDSPASNAASITPSNTDDLPHVPRALYALGEGNVRVTMRGGGDPVVLPILVGVPLPVRVSRVWASGTTATGLVEGNVRVTMRGGGDPVVLPILVGVPLPVRVSRVWASGTTATGLVGIW
nr:hypothetical protein [Ketogulonicigenium vulgare]